MRPRPPARAARVLLDDEERAREFCGRGDEIVPPSPGRTRGLRGAGRQIGSDWNETLAPELIKAIEALVSTVPDSEPIAECPADVAEPTAPGEAEIRALDGIYVTRVTRRDRLEAGVTDPEHFRDNTGVSPGRWTEATGTTSSVRTTTCRQRGVGTYTYEDGLFTLYWGSGEVITARVNSPATAPCASRTYTTT